MYCKHCGHELNEKAVICTNCGFATDNFMQTAKPANSQQQTNTLAIVGMICAIVGSIGGNFFLCIPSIVGLVLSFIGMERVKEYKSGEGFAITGIIIGAISLMLWMIILMLIYSP